MAEVNEVSDMIFDMDIDIAEGLIVNDRGTSLKVTDDYVDADDQVVVPSIDQYGDSIVTINSTERNNNLHLIGNDKGNVITLGTGANTIDGGAGLDSIYLNEGSDLILYTAGQGNDQIYNFDYMSDVVSIEGVSEVGLSNFYNVGTRVNLALGDNTLAFLRQEEPKFVVEYGGNSVDVDLTDMTFSSNLQNLVLGADFYYESLDAGEYSQLQNINAAAVDKEITLLGNAHNNNISIGSSGGVLNGVSGNNKLYGGDGDDVFVYTSGQGSNVTIYNYASGDEISIGGITTLSNDSIIPIIGQNSIVVDLGVDSLLVYGYDRDAEITFVYGDAESPERLDFDPRGILYSVDRRAVYLYGDSYLNTEYSAAGNPQLITIDAASLEAEIDLIGNENNNVLRLGQGGGVVDGGSGRDNLYGSENRDTFIHTVGTGFDTIQNFNGDDDEVSLVGRTETITAADFLNVGNGTIYLNLGDDTLTFINASGEMNFQFGTEDDPMSFTFDPGGLIFNDKRTAITLTADYKNEDDEFRADGYDQLISINAASVDTALNIFGNSNANKITVGSDGGSVDGGAGADTIYGGRGSDQFIYTVGSGADTIQNYGEGDEIFIFGVDGELTDKNFRNVGNGVLLIDLGNDTLTINEFTTEESIKVYYGSTDATDLIEHDPSGATLSADDVLVVDDSFPSEDLQLSNYDGVSKVDARKRTTELNIYGDDDGNEISVGTGGGIIDGGGGADKIYGGRGADDIVYTVNASGADTIYNYDSTDEDRSDQIRLIGIDDLDQSAYKILSNGTVAISLGNDTLTIVNPKGVVNVVNESGSELITIDSTGTQVVNNKLLTINNSYNGETVDAANYSPELETITATQYTRGGLYILGNSNDNVLRAGTGGMTLDGATGDDTLVGDLNCASEDVFAYSIGSGRKTITNFAATVNGGEDSIAVFGYDGTIDESNFNENGTTTTLTLGYDEVVLINPQGRIAVIDENGSELYTYGLPDGLSLRADKRLLAVFNGFSDSPLDAATLNNLISTITARDYTDEIEIIGNSNDNSIRAGSGGSTLDGGPGDDKLMGGAGQDVFLYTPGEGNDSIYNFDASNESSPDMIKIEGIDSLSKDSFRVSGDNLQIMVGGNTLTLVNPRGAVTIFGDDDEPMTMFDVVGTTLANDDRKLLVYANYPDSILSADNYSTLVSTIDARAFPDPLVIEGNSNSNYIFAGPGGSTMDGAGYIDYLYGNDGADIFRYRAGQGNEFFYNFNSTLEGAVDAIQLIGVTSIEKSDFKDTANGNTVIRIGSNTLTLVDPIGAITVFGENMYDDFDELEPMFVYSKSLPSGVSYNFNKTKLTIGRNADLPEDEDRVIDVADWSNNLKHVDASEYPEEITLHGDSKSNSLLAGTGGSSLDGGMGFDHLYGGSGADTFVYTVGEGNDYIYNFDSTNEDSFDVVQIFGDVGNISRSNFRDSGRNTVLNLGSNQLTFMRPLGQITLLDSEGDTIMVYSSTLPSGIYYNENKTELTIDRSAELEDNLIDMVTLSNNLRNINATTYEGELYLVGNEKSNVLRAGSGGSTLDGRGGSDKLYGGADTDVFVVSVGGGNDVIYNYDGTQGDVLMLMGNASVGKSSFQDSGNNTFFGVGSGKVMLDNAKGAITVVDENENELFVYGTNLPTGVYYESNKTRLVIGSNADLEDAVFEVDDYVNNLRDIDASAYEGTGGLVLLGNEKSNELRAGSGGSSLNGGRGNDKLYGGAGEDVFAYVAGEGNDYFYDFDGSQGDVVQLYGTSRVSRSNFKDVGNNIVLTVGDNQLTFINPIGPINLIDENGNDLLEEPYEVVLPSIVYYNGNKTKLTIGRGDELEDPTFDMATLSNSIKDIDASRYEYLVNLIGNDKANELRASSGNSSLDGGLGNDKYYGGSGADTYVVSVGGGSDMIYNYDGTQGDVIQLFGIDTIDSSNFQDNGTNVILNVGTDRIHINNPVGQIVVVLGDSTDTVGYGGSLPNDVSYSTDKTTLTIKRGADLGDNNLFDMDTLSNRLKNIDASGYDGLIVMHGNSKGNELRAGTDGSSIDGGLGNDKLYGGSDADTFVYHAGEGNDHIYNFDGTDEDVIQVFDLDTSSITENNFRDSGRNTIITLGSNRLTLVDAQGRIRLIDENGDVLVTYNETLPDGVTYNTNKTRLTIGSNADLGDNNLFDMATLSNNLRTIDASAYEGEVILQGNRKSNDLYAGAGGSSLNGGDGSDKLYGGSGEDVFAYVAGEGNDYIYDYDGSDGDIIRLYGVTSLSDSSIKDSGENVIITIGSNKLTLVNPQGQIVLEDEDGTQLATHNETLPSGISYSANKLKMIVSADTELEENTLEVSNFDDKLRDIDASAYGSPIVLIGDDKANEFYAGTDGATLDGGLGNDQLYGGEGADVFVYTAGSGNDFVYNFDSTNEDAADVIQLLGVAALTKSDFRDSGKNTMLTVGNQRLTLVDPKGQISVIGSDGELLETYGTTLPSGVAYSSNKTKMTIGRNADLNDSGNVFDMATLSNNLKDIDASNYGEELVMIGNDKPNELRAGSGGATLNGGLGNDKLYGGTGADVFRYTVDEGNDYIYNFNSEQGDMLMLEGAGNVDASDFRDSGKNVILSLGTNHLTFVNPTGPISVIGSDGEEIFVYGAPLTSGLTYNDDKTKLTITDGADLEDSTINVNDYVNSLKDLDASDYSGELVLVGNEKVNELHAGSGGSTLIGGEGADKLYGGEGADVFEYAEGDGNDRIFNYGENDTIHLTGVAEISKSDFKDSGKNTVLMIGTQRITIVNPTTAITVQLDDDDEPITYGHSLASGVAYNSSKTKLTVRSSAELSDEDKVIDMEEYSNNLKDVDASKYDGELEIHGNDKNNVIKAGSGGSTLGGGLGNDKLYGNDGEDVFVYSGGSDVFYNFDVESDRIELVDKTIIASRISGNDIVYNVENGSFTVKNVAQHGMMGLNITEVSSSDQLPSTANYSALNELFKVDSSVEDPLEDILSIENMSIDRLEVDKEYAPTIALALEVNVENYRTERELGIGARRR